MESQQLQKNQTTEGPLEEETSRPIRFRIIKLQERIAPNTAAKKTWDCEGDYTDQCVW